jgi:hypothetical protein
VGYARAKLSALFIAAVIAATVTGAARADGGPGDARTAARARGEQGLQLFEAKRWGDAYAAFREADALYHAPTLTLFMGHCERNQGRLVEAKALYGKLVSEPVPVAAPEQFRKAQAQARAELDALGTRIPKLFAVATGPAGEGALFEVDGVAVDAGALAAGVEVNPGRHAVAAKSSGASGRSSVTVAEGEESRVQIALLAEEPAAAKDGGGEARGRRGSILPGVVALGAGGVFTAIGAITGGLAAGKVSDIKSRCRTIGGAEHCLVSDIPARDSAQTLITVSTVGLVAGGALLLAGTGLVILRPGGGSAPARLEVDAGLTAIHLRGSF